MLKPILISLAVLSALALLVYFVLPRNQLMICGKFRHLPQRFSELINGIPKIESLIIGIGTTDDFIQFSRDATVIELDFPLITERQKELEDDYRKICSDLGIDLIETTGSDGSRFLDADVPTDPEDLARISQTFLTRLYDADESTKLRFTLIPEGI